MVARARDAKVPFEDSYFPRSHRCHTSPAILRLSLHCGNHNYTCGCLLIAPRPILCTLRYTRIREREREKRRERERNSLVRASFPVRLILLHRRRLPKFDVETRSPSRREEIAFEKARFFRSQLQGRKFVFKKLVPLASECLPA